MTTDRAPKACTVRAGGVTVSAQAKGAGMIEPGFATMLCFVQTDAEIADPEAALRARGRGLVRADHRRRADEHQRHRPAAGDRRGRRAAARRAARRRPAAARARDRRRRRGRDPGRPDRGRASAADADEAERVARAIANSPLVKTALYGRDPNWGRIAQAAGMALAGEELDELGPDAIDAAELGGEERGGRDRARLGRGDARARTSTSPTSPTSTSGSTRSTRHDRDEGAIAASRRCSRRCPTSASSTAARW